MAWRPFGFWSSTFLCSALACVGPAHQDVRIELPPLAQDDSRVILYMAVATELPGYCPSLTLDKERVGKLCVGNFFVVDRPPGAHEVGVGIDRNLSAFGEQGATEPVDLTLAPGETAYVQVYALAMSQSVKVMLTREPAMNGLRDISSLHFENPPRTP
jgi:hypothetical protein